MLTYVTYVTSTSTSTHTLLALQSQSHNNTYKTVTRLKTDISLIVELTHDMTLTLDSWPTGTLPARHGRRTWTGICCHQEIATGPCFSSG